MKIALTNAFLPNESKGGVPYQVHYLANALVNRGHDVTVYTFSPAFEECQYKVHQYSRSQLLKKPQALCTFLMAARLAKTDFSDFDVLHASGDNYLLRHPHLRTFYGSARDEAAVAVRFRRRAYQSVIARLEDVGARRAQVNIGISEATRVRIPAVSQVIPCGVDLTAFHPGLKSETPTLLFVGTTGGRKRGSFLAEIFQREIRSKIPNAQFWTVAEKPIEGPGIINWGKIPLDKLVLLFQQAWAFCLPSTYEGFGVPYIEAMASGTPAIASPNAGAKEVLDHGKYGVIAEDKDLGTAILTLLQDSALRQSYVEKGIVRAQEFSWNNIADQYEDLFHQHISQRQNKDLGKNVR
jgi:phosphatidylinositol alpha-mannosyltransferase